MAAEFLTEETQAPAALAPAPAQKAERYVAIDPLKNVYEFTRKGIEDLQRSHLKQGKKGWRYGRKEDLKDMLAEMATPQEAAAAYKLLEAKHQAAMKAVAEQAAEVETLKAENEALKAEVETLKAKKTK